MKVLMFRENTAVIIKSIDSVEWHHTMKDCKARVTIGTKQLIFTEFFETDEEAKSHFNKIIKVMEKCRD
jgi:hypothetical protein